MPMVNRICQNCGHTYRTHDSVRKQYCSITCYGQAKRRGFAAACAACGKEFYAPPSDSGRRYCSISCAVSARNRTEANPSFHRDLSGANNPMFGKGLEGINNPMYGRRTHLAPQWSGGRLVRPDGYVLVIAPANHPHPATVKRSGTKYILEHRHVMEQHLGRFLHPGEVVHHIDGNPSNNALANLRLFASHSEHIRVAHGHS